MGTGAFVYAPKYSKFGLAGTGILGPPIFVIMTIWRLLLEIIYRFKNGHWLKKDNSRVLDKENKFKKRSLIPPLIHAVTNDGYLIVMSAAWNFAKRGGLNQGVISTLLSFAGVFNVATFYCFFKQKITAWQGVGIAFMIICVLCLTIESNNKRS